LEQKATKETKSLKSPESRRQNLRKRDRHISSFPSLPSVQILSGQHQVRLILPVRTLVATGRMLC